MKKIVLILFAVVVTVYFTDAQQKSAFISFEDEVHDFGKINEDGGKVEHKFIFTNTGSSPLIVTNVKASCGCTSPTWSEKPIMPGQKGFVSAVFDPVRRPGNFNKSIFVSSNGAENRKILRIKGEVLPKQRTVEDNYPKTIGRLRLETNHFAFVRVHNTEVKQDRLKIYNSSDSKMKVTFENVPAYLKLSSVPAELRPGEEAFILGEFNGAKVNDWGFVTARVNILVNGIRETGNYLTVSAKVEEDFSKLTETDLENAPKIEFESREYDFGKTNKNKIEHEFTFTNKGKTDLHIRKIRSTCGCTTVAPEKKVIKPGETSSFKAIFTPGSRKGNQRKSVYVISNDPKHSEVRLVLKGTISD